MNECMYVMYTHIENITNVMYCHSVFQQLPIWATNWLWMKGFFYNKPIDWRRDANVEPRFLACSLRAQMVISGFQGVGALHMTIRALKLPYMNISNPLTTIVICGICSESQASSVSFPNPATSQDVLPLLNNHYVF